MGSFKRCVFGLALGLSMLPVAAQAQIARIPGTSTGAITFGTDNVLGPVVGGPAFTPQVVFGGNNYGYLVGPGGGVPDRANGLAPVAAVAGNLPQALISGVNGQFGGGSVVSFSNNNGAWFNNLSLRDVPNAGLTPASVALAANQASFIVGPAGFAGTVGSFFSIGGLLPNPQPGAYLAASLSTIIDVFNPNPALNQSFYARTWLGYQGGLNGFIGADGVNSPYANGNPAAGQPNVQTAMLFGAFGANSFSSAASITTAATFVAGTQFTVTNYLTMIANLGPGPALNNNAVFVLNGPDVPTGVDRPDFGATGGLATAPEPGSVVFVALAIVGMVPIARRRKA